MRTLAGAATRIGLNELYVSLEALPLDDPSTPAKLLRLKEAGLRIGALIDGEAPDEKIARIVAFNRKQPDPMRRFDGVHYDFEPWIGAGTSTAWVQQAIAMYDQARAALAPSSLGLSVDISGAKLAALSAADQQRLRRAVPRIVIMQYEAPAERVASRSEALMRASPENDASMIIAVRVKDFGCGTLELLNRLESKDRSFPSYAGWAIYDYEDFVSRCADAVTRPR
jgi:hypothetical protein